MLSGALLTLSDLEGMAAVAPHLVSLHEIEQYRGLTIGAAGEKGEKGEDGREGLDSEALRVEEGGGEHSPTREER